MNKHFVYPEAEEIIRNSGLDDRIQEENLTDMLRHEPDLVTAIKRHKEYHPDEIYTRELIQISNNSAPKHYWKIQRHEGEEKVKPDWHDADIFSARIASLILAPEEVKNYSGLGFKSASELIGVVSAHILNISRKEFYERHEWITTLPDGRIMKNSVGTISFGDLDISQQDITPYHCKDVFGQDIRMRPVTDSDKGTLASSRTSESSALLSILKYIDQEGIKSEIYEDNARSLIEWAEKNSKRKHLQKKYESETEREFMLHYTAFPRLDEEMKTSFKSSGNLYIGINKELIFSWQINNGKINPKGIFMPEDADQLIKGLVYNSALNSETAPAEQLTAILEYRFSEEFERDKEKYNQYDKHVL